MSDPRRTGAMIAVLSGGVIIGVVLAFSPLVAFGVAAAAVVVVFGRTPERVLALAIASEMLFTGIGKVYQVSLGPVSLNGSVVFDALVIGLGLLVLSATRARFIHVDQLWLYLLIIVAATSILLSYDAFASVKGVIKLCVFAVMYALARQVGASGEEPLRRIIYFTTALASLVAGMALVEWVRGESLIGAGAVAQNIYSTTGEAVLELRRARSTFSHPNQMAVVMGSIGILSVGFWRWWNRRWFLFAALACAAAVALSFSRVVWGAMLIAGIGVLFSVIERKRRLPALVALIVAGVLIEVTAGALIRQRLGFDSSAALRLQLIQVELGLVGDNPLLGIGYDAFRSISAGLFGYTVEAHGDYVRVLVETGVLGLTAFVLWLGSQWLKLQRWALRVKDERVRALFRAGAAVVVVYAVFAVTDNAIQGMGMFVVILGLLDGLGSRILMSARSRSWEA